MDSLKFGRNMYSITSRPWTVEESEEVLRARLKTEAQRGKTLFGSSKFRQKVTDPPDRPRDVNHRSVHVVRAAPEESSSEGPAWIIRKTRRPDVGISSGSGKRKKYMDHERPSLQIV